MDRPRFGWPLATLPVAWVWTFDLLRLNERDLRKLPTRKDRTKNLTTRKPPGLGGGFLSEVIGWAPRGLRTQWRL
jgi:hypothetical protein